MRDMSAVVLCGGRTSRGTTMALETVADVPMVQWVLTALQHSGIEDIVIVIDPDEAPDTLDKYKIVTPGATIHESVANGIICCDNSTVLIVDGAAPGVTSQAVNDFICMWFSTYHNPEDLRSRLTVSMVPARRVEVDYPGVHTSSLPIHGEYFTLGALFILEKGVPPQAYAWLHKMYGLRKNKLQTAAAVGWDLILRVLLVMLVRNNPDIVCRWSLLRLDMVTDRIAHHTGMAIEAQILLHTGVGADVDSDEDLAAMDQIMRSRLKRR